MIERTEQEIMSSWKGDTSKPLISVCTITYNHELYITEAMESFLMQKTDFPFEIVIDDDCSTDNNSKVIKQYADKFPNIIKANLREKNVGIMKNFTENIKRAKGKYIALCEGDDYWIDKDKLQIQIDLMRKHQDCDISFHSARIVFEDKSKETTVISRHAKKNKIFTINEVILGGGEFCPTASLIIKSEILKNLPNWFSQAPIGDYFIQILGSFNGGALYIDRTMSIYRRSVPGSWSSSMRNIKKQEKNLKNKIISLDQLDAYTEYKFSSEIDIVKSKMYFTWAKYCLRLYRFQEFKDAINKSHDTNKKRSIRKYIYFYLKEYPIILLLITKPSLIFKKLRNEDNFKSS